MENNLPAGSGRLLALDVLRGMTVAGMILVNNPGSWGAVYAPLRHASWNGLTPTDLVFPLFMFIMGVSTYLSLRKYDFACSGAAVRKILVRTAVIFAVGLAVGWFSRFCFSMQSLAEQGVPLWERVARSANNFDRIRVLGVLQRLALSYGAGALIAVTVRRRAIPWIAAGLLAAYGLILLSGNGFDLSPDNVVAVVDRAVLGEAHMYRGEGFPFDPEGLLSTVPSVAHVLIGFCIGRALVSEEELKLKILKILRWGALLMLAGWLLGYLCPVNKKVWSPSFVLLTCGVAASALALLMWTINVRGHRRWSRFFEVFGVNPLFLYVTASVLSVVLLAVRVPCGGETMSLQAVVYSHGLRPWLGDYPASLAYPLLLVGAVWLIGLPLYRKRIYVKI